MTYTPEPPSDPPVWFRRLQAWGRLMKTDTVAGLGARFRTYLILWAIIVLMMIVLGTDSMLTGHQLVLIPCAVYGWIYLSWLFVKWKQVERSESGTPDTQWKRE